MKNFKKFSLGIAMLITFLSFGQEKTITGTVSDRTGPLPGANVVVKGTTRAAQTNFDGKYAILAKEGETLVFSFTGYNSKTQIVGKSNTINVILEDGVHLSEVVIDGYRATPKRKSSVAQTTVADQSIAYGFNTKKAIVFKKKAENENQPTLIRGVSTLNTSTKPLYVIDGVPVKEEDFRKLNPNDINSATVLKDTAASSVYGSRAASGVVVIKTKNGVQQNLSDKELKKRIKEIDKATTPIAVEPNNEDYESFVENAFESPKSAPLSTFSIDVDNASYTNVRRFINGGQTVPKDAVRVEEMVISLNTNTRNLPGNIHFPLIPNTVNVLGILKTNWFALVCKAKIFQLITCRLPIWFS